MEKELDNPIVLDAAAVAAIDAFASTKTQLVQPESGYRIFISHSCYRRDITAVEEYRKWLQAQLQEFVVDDNGPSQRSFWNFFDHVANRKSRRHAGFVIAHELFHEALAPRNRKRPAVIRQPELAISDGKHRRISYENSSRDLSIRAIRSVLLTAIEQLHNVDRAQTVFDVLEVLDNSLIQEVAKRIRWRDRPRSFDLERNTAPSTREWVLGFHFRTGNPPPHSDKSCPAECWVIVTITDARREDYATIQGQEVSRNLRNAICGQRVRARFNRSTQDHANHRGSWQPARYRPPLPHYSLAQCA